MQAINYKMDITVTPYEGMEVDTLALHNELHRLFCILFAECKITIESKQLAK